MTAAALRVRRLEAELFPDAGLERYGVEATAYLRKVDDLYRRQILQIC